MNLYEQLYERFQKLGMMAEGAAMHENTLTAMKVFEDWLEDFSVTPIPAHIPIGSKIFENSILLAQSSVEKNRRENST